MVGVAAGLAKGGLPAGRLRPERLRARARAGADQARRLLRGAAGRLRRRRRGRRLQHARAPATSAPRTSPPLRALPHLAILSPADACEMTACMDLALRGRRAGLPAHGQGRPAGRSTRRRRSCAGASCARCAPAAGRWRWIATGSMVPTGPGGVDGAGPVAPSCSAPCLKPLRPEPVAGVCRRHEAVVVLEEHSVYGGLGSAVAEIASTHAPDLGVPRRRPRPVLARPAAATST